MTSGVTLVGIKLNRLSRVNRSVGYLGALGMAAGTAILFLALSAQGGWLRRMDTAIAQAPQDLVLATLTRRTDSGAKGSPFRLGDGFTLAEIERLRGTGSVARIAAESQPWNWRAPIPRGQETEAKMFADVASGPLDFSFRAVSPEYFDLLRIPFAAGRNFAASGSNEAVLGIALSETLGRIYRAGEPPVPAARTADGSKEPYTWDLGSTVAYPFDKTDNQEASFRDRYEVVGVLAPIPEEPNTCVGCDSVSAYFMGLAVNRNYTIFVPPGRLPSFFGRIATAEEAERVRKTGQLPPVVEVPPPDDLYAAWIQPQVGAYQDMRRDVTEVVAGRLDGRSVLFIPQSLVKTVFVRSRQSVARGFALIAVAILAVATLNITNACAVWVLQRVREIGIRRANGASRWQIQRLVLGQAAKLVFLGGTGGILGGLALIPVGRAILGEDLAIRPFAFAAVLGLLAVASLAAAAFPARSAARLTPSGSISGAAGLGGPRFRKLIAVAGVTVGVAAVTVVAALSAGTQADLRRLMSAVGDDVLEVRGQDPFNVGGAQRAVPTFEDVAALSRRLGPDRSVAGWTSRTAPVTFGTQVANRDVVVASRQLPALLGLEFEVGRYPEGDREVALGAALAAQYFTSPEAAIGAGIQIGDLELVVSGVLRARPPAVLDMGPDRDTSLFVSDMAREALALRLGALPDPVLLVQHGGKPKETRAVIETYYAERAKDALGPIVRSPVGQLQLLAESRQRLASVFKLTAFLSLVLGVAGVTIVLLALSIERRREIGIRRATGAGRLEIFRLIVGEAVALCTGGGLVGVMAGSAAVVWISRQNGWTLALPLVWALAGLVTAAVAGVLAGLGPAYVASALPPVAAIRD